jgi:hypothetical protein
LTENFGGFFGHQQPVRLGAGASAVRGGDFFSDNLSNSVQQKLKRVFCRIIHFVPLLDSRIWRWSKSFFLVFSVGPDYKLGGKSFNYDFEVALFLCPLRFLDSPPAEMT